MTQALAVREVVKVYRVAIAAGYDQRTAMRAANIATRTIARQDSTTVGGWEIWKGIKTPGQIRDEINRIDGEVKSTGSDLASLEFQHLHSADGPEITNFMNVVWEPFITSWTNFWRGHQGWTDNFWGDTWDQAQTFQKQLIAIRDKAKDLGLPLQSADPIRQPDNVFESIAKALWRLAKAIIIVGLIVGGIIALTRFA